MKYVVTGININREDYKVHTFKDGKITQEEIIDTETNSLFKNCKNVWEIEDRYEQFWNRINDGYVNHEIVKVLDVSPIIPFDLTKKGNLIKWKDRGEV